MDTNKPWIDSPDAEPEEADIEVRPRAAREITLSIPVEALAQLEKVALRHDMSLQGLLKFYVGQGLREDTARAWAEPIASEEERAAMLLETTQGGAV